MNGQHVGGEQVSNFPVAVVGIAGRFPDAADVQTFWANLCAGRDPIKTVPEERWDWRAYFGEVEDGKARTYANSGGFTPFIDCFDAGFFGILPREAQSMDPQQRLFLQTCFAALEDAGLAPHDLSGASVSVFAGVGFPDYQARMRQDQAPYDTYRGTGIVPAAIANRVSFALDLHGPSETIDTACSGSLIAVHRAIQSLRLGESKIAIAGGVNLLIGPELFIAFGQAGMLSRSARCRTFDASADGYVRSEGVGALILRPLADAEKNGDFIYGVLRGSAVNHGGKAHSFTAPNVAAQAALLTSAWQAAQCDMADAVLVETHGTGTPLGDPIEFEGLKRALSANPASANPARPQKTTALGALKTNIGHLEGAAGIAGLIKALLALHHRLIPANIHYETLNPKIDLDGTPFYIPDHAIVLDAAPGVRLTAGVSSFGFGGSNAHVVLENYQSAPCTQGAEPAARPYLFVLSARTQAALIGRARQLVEFLGLAPAAMAHIVSVGELCSALRIAQPPEGGGDVLLSELEISLEQLIVALCRIGHQHNGEVTISAVRDCVTLKELAACIGECLRGAPAFAMADAELLLPNVAIRDDLRAAASPASISYTLMQGREAMSERLAIVADSRASLLDQLRKFLAQPNQHTRTLFSGSVRRTAMKGDEVFPAAARSGRDGDDLCAWAGYWVSARTAALNWTELHAQEAPAKTPLPSYPFALKRHWYAARTATQNELAPARAQPIEPRERDHSKAAGPSLLAAAHLPCSARGLAMVLAEVARNGAANAASLSSLMFGAPIDVTGNGLKCVRVTSGGDTTAQCLHTQPGGAKVVLQARISSTVITPVLCKADRVALELCAVDNALKRTGLAFTAADIGITSAQRSRDSVAFDVRYSKTRDEKDILQAALAGLFAGHALLHSGTAGVPHLFRADTAGCDGGRLRSLVALTIEHCTNGRLRLVATNPEGAPVLWIDGLELRPAPSAGTASPQSSHALEVSHS